MSTRPSRSSPSVNGAPEVVQPAGEPRRRDQPDRRRHEGLRAGLIGATSVWVWLLASDAVARTPLSTPALLGSGLLSVDVRDGRIPWWAGVLAFTVAHYALWIGIGALAVRAVRAAARAPSVLVFAGVVFILLQFLFVGITAILAQGRLGPMAWRDLLVGDAVGCAAAAWYVLRHHRELRAELAQAAEGDR